ncbi:MAG TPA: DUF3830 family protein [Candidatus Dormibacteraeota bacterium]|nr:DUF3830 family protein [Candidatus Dormibacteraeota bacterium]
MTNGSDIRILVAGMEFGARLEGRAAPRTCAAFLGLLPLHASLLQARWSGESAWVPLGNLDLALGPENPTSHPAPGQLLLYPGGLSETEILFPYGATLFASKVGQLAGNHFATLHSDAHPHLAELGRRVLWHGAQDVEFEVR